MSDDQTRETAVALPERFDMPTRGAPAAAPGDDALDVAIADEGAARKPSKGSDGTDAGIAALRRQLAEEQTSRERERAARQQAEQRANYSDVARHYDAAKREMDELERRIVTHNEQGEFQAASKLQGEMARTAAKLQTYELAAAEMEQRSRQPQQQQPIASWDAPWGQSDFERYVATRTPETAAWLREHGEFASDPGFRKRVAGAHEYVTSTLGIAADTPEYFQKVEDAVGLRGDDGEHEPPATRSAESVSQPRATAQSPTSSAATSRSRISPTPAAPPSRKTPTSNNYDGTGDRVVLSREEAAAAQFLFPDDKPEKAIEKYARNKRALVREQRIGPGARDGR